jgi:hypothetical protein
MSGFQLWKQPLCLCLIGGIVECQVHRGRNAVELHPVPAGRDIDRRLVDLPPGMKP